MKPHKKIFNEAYENKNYVISEKDLKFTIYDVFLADNRDLNDLRSQLLKYMIKDPKYRDKAAKILKAHGKDRS